MGEQEQRTDDQVNLAHRMGFAQPRAQQQVLPLGLMQPCRALSGHLQLFLQHCLGGLQGPRKHPLLLVEKQGGYVVSRNPYALQHLAVPDSFYRDSLRPCLLFLPLPSICSSLQSLPRYPSQAPDPPSRTPSRTSFQGHIPPEHTYQYPFLLGSHSRLLSSPCSPILQNLPFHSLLFSHPKGFVSDSNCLILTHFSLLSRSPQQKLDPLLPWPVSSCTPRLQTTTQRAPPTAPPPPHLQLALEDFGCLQPLTTAPQLLLQAWQAAGPLAQCLCLLAVELGAFGLAGQCLGLIQMV